MPTISLRLTDKQHDALAKWARDGERSVQKELIWRLFTQEHFATAVEQVEKRVTEEIRAFTGRDDLRAEFDTTPVLPRGACAMNVPRGTKCKVCGKVHPL